jgi:hypothetical protein
LKGIDTSCDYQLGHRSAVPKGKPPDCCAGHWGQWSADKKKPSCESFSIQKFAKKKGPLNFKGPFKLVARARFELATFGL